MRYPSARVVAGVAIVVGFAAGCGAQSSTHTTVASDGTFATPTATGTATAEPRSEGSCVDWVAVELFANDVEQVVAVNLVWAEP